MCIRSTHADYMLPNVKFVCPHQCLNFDTKTPTVNNPFNKLAWLSSISNQLGLVSPFVCVHFAQLNLIDPQLQYDWLYL